VPQCNHQYTKDCYKVVFLAYAHKYYLKQVAENSKGKSKNNAKMNWTAVALRLFPSHWRSIGQNGQGTSKKMKVNKYQVWKSCAYNYGISCHEDLDLSNWLQVFEGLIVSSGLILPFADSANVSRCATHGSCCAVHQWCQVRYLM